MRTFLRSVGIEITFPFNWFPSEWEASEEDGGDQWYWNVSIQLVSQRVGSDECLMGRAQHSLFPFNWFPSEWEGLASRSPVPQAF